MMQEGMRTPDTGGARRRLAMCLNETEAHLVLVPRTDLAIVLRRFDARDDRRYGREEQSP